MWVEPFIGFANTEYPAIIAKKLPIIAPAFISSSTLIDPNNLAATANNDIDSPRLEIVNVILIIFLTFTSDSFAILSISFISFITDTITITIIAIDCNNFAVGISDRIPIDAVNKNSVIPIAFRLSYLTFFLCAAASAPIESNIPDIELNT